MKRKLIAMLSAVLVLTAALAMPVLAEDDQELSDGNQTGNTDVEAQITGTSGDVSYIVTVPKKIDFGKLVAPENNTTDSFVTKDFKVRCTKKSESIDRVKVWVMNQGSETGEKNQKFFLSNTTNADCKFKPEYDLLAGSIKIDTSTSMEPNGYEFYVFPSVSEANGTAKLNQKQLYDYRTHISDIAGTYSGILVFTSSAITTNTNTNP